MGISADNGIKVIGFRKHTKASEEYADVVFRYSGTEMNWSIPIEYRRTGTHLAGSSTLEVEEYLGRVYESCNPLNWPEFLSEQRDFWALKPKATITKSFFDELAKGFEWKSVKHDLPVNSNSQRRIQDLKEFGFTIATNTRLKHSVTGEVSTHHLLVPLPRGGITGYETWSPALRKRIIEVLGAVDAYETPGGNIHNLLPDHKFPEIRWDADVKRNDLEKLTDDDIRRDFQLITNQRNQQKREACRSCLQSSNRPGLFGIDFYSVGTQVWPKDIPIRGKEAEVGCQGCGWYDIIAWKAELNSRLRGEN